MIMDGVNYNHPRVWNPLDDDYYNGSSFARAVKPHNTPTLLEQRGLTIASVNANTKQWIAHLRAIVDDGNDRRSSR